LLSVIAAGVLCPRSCFDERERSPVASAAGLSGRPEIKPKTVVFACGDGNFGFDHLTWVAWGGSRAVALGSGYLNDCQPYCAAGHFTRYPAVLIATGSQRCPNGQRAYLTVTYAFIGRSPFPPRASGTFHPRQNFRCGKGGLALR
jgi:hypothetical protein